jgi:hypothetical protein
MKDIVKNWIDFTALILAFIILLLMPGCISLKKCNERYPPKIGRKDSVSREITYLKHDSLIRIPGDSAWYYALIECMQDKNGKWIPTVSEQNTSNGNRIRMSSQIMDGRLQVNCTVDTMAIGIWWLEKHTKDLRVSYIRDSYPVEAKLSWWKSTMIIGGYILMGMILLIVVYVILRIKKIISF